MTPEQRTQSKKRKARRKRAKKQRQKNMQAFGTPYSHSAWDSMRKDHLALYPECRICGDINKGNHVHHLRYRGTMEQKRGTYERPGDLVTLCAGHHYGLHSEHALTKKKLTLDKFTLQYIEEQSVILSYELEEFLDFRQNE
jgi:hypothetical protein